MNTFIAILLVALHCATVSVARLQRRDNYTTTLPTLDVPLSFDVNRRYVASVDLSVNSTAQPFGFALSTSTGYCVVAGTACDSCGETSSYNESLSSTADAMNGAKSIQLFNGSASGPMIKETCSLREQNGSPWMYPNQTVIVANQSNAMFSPDVSGILGLGTNSNQGRFSDTIFLGWLTRNPSWNMFSFSMALNPPNQPGTDGGMLHLLTPDDNSYQGPVSWSNVLTSTANSSVDSDWTVQLNSWSFRSGSNNVSNNDNNLQVIMDPYYSNLYVPQDEARLIYSSIPGAALQSTSSNMSEIWTVPCTTQMELSVNLGGQFFTLDQSNLLIHNNGTCTSAIEGWSDSSTTAYLFGATFISSVYMTFNVYMPGTGSNCIGIALRAAKHKSEVGLIVGATLGSVAVSIAIGVAIFVVYRLRRKPVISSARQEVETIAIQPDQKTSLTSKPRPAYLESVVPPMNMPLISRTNSHISKSSDDNPHIHFAENNLLPQSPTLTSSPSHLQSSSHQSITISLERNCDNLLRNSHFDHDDPMSPRPQSISADTRPLNLLDSPVQNLTVDPYSLQRPTVPSPDGSQGEKVNHPGPENSESPPSSPSSLRPEPESRSNTMGSVTLVADPAANAQPPPYTRAHPRKWF